MYKVNNETSTMSLGMQAARACLKSGHYDTRLKEECLYYLGLGYAIMMTEKEFDTPRTRNEIATYKSLCKEHSKDYQKLMNKSKYEGYVI